MSLTSYKDLIAAPTEPQLNRNELGFTEIAEDTSLYLRTQREHVVLTAMTALLGAASRVPTVSLEQQASQQTK
jgi:hypothetical protein